MPAENSPLLPVWANIPRRPYFFALSITLTAAAIPFFAASSFIFAFSAAAGQGVVSEGSVLFSAWSWVPTDRGGYVRALRLSR
jgi:hypothetical protein